MNNVFESIEQLIEQDGFMSAQTLKHHLGVERADLDTLVNQGLLCVLSGGCYDLPARRDARVAHWREVINKKMKLTDR